MARSAGTATRGASYLAAYLKKKWGSRDEGFGGPGKLPERLKGKKGIILFERIPSFSGQGHMDVFNGAEGKTGTYWDSKTVWFCTLKYDRLNTLYTKTSLSQEHQ